MDRPVTGELDSCTTCTLPVATRFVPYSSAQINSVYCIAPCRLSAEFGGNSALHFGCGALLLAESQFGGMEICACSGSGSVREVDMMDM